MVHEADDLTSRPYAGADRVEKMSGMGAHSACSEPRILEAAEVGKNSHDWSPAGVSPARQPLESSSQDRRGGERRACRGRRSPVRTDRCRKDVLFVLCPVAHPSPAPGASQPAVAPRQNLLGKLTEPLSRIPQRPVNCCDTTCAVRAEAAAFQTVSIPSGLHSAQRPPHGWCGGGRVSGWVVWRKIDHVDASPKEVVCLHPGGFCENLWLKMGS